MNAHGGALAVAAAQAYGIDTLFTLSGGHVFPLYDGAVKADPAMRILDVRHEQTAVFAAEAYAKLTRRPGLAVLTAGPGVTNGVSAVTTGHFNASPLLVLGGRAPAARWGSGSLQELDHPPILAPVTKRAATVETTDAIPRAVADALALALSPRRGPVFLDVPMDVLFSYADADIPQPAAPAYDTTGDPARVAALIQRAERPVVIAGSDVWYDGAEAALRTFAEAHQVPVIANGMGRGCLPADHPLSFSRVRGTAFAGADLVVVVGTPLDFRLAFGAFGSAKVVHVVNAPSEVARHVTLEEHAAGPLADVLEVMTADGSHAGWTTALRAEEEVKRDAEAAQLATDTSPIHPARVYGELRPRLARDAVVVCDGGDFVSFAGKYVESYEPGCWLDPGPYGCLGTGLGYAIAARLARPDSQVVLLLGDGAAGFSLMDVDTLVRHRLPVVMVCGNNGIWGLEKHPMQFLYGYDVAADLQPECRYDEVVRALGGHGELVTDVEQIGPALDRAFASGLPAMVNVVTDPTVAYPRTSNLA
ncbi:MAG TPA: acetolactate synthase [Frankiaceae bacterium]|nr:acetolactate synthase [Frankiaceae bacterium]